MSANFQIKVKKRNGNLRVSPSGDFDGSSAWELLNFLDQEYDGSGQVIIDTNKLRNMCPFGCDTFRCRVQLSRLPSNRLSFEGEKGYEIAPKGCRVMVFAQKVGCRCDGNCANCPCAAKKNRN